MRAGASSGIRWAPLNAAEAERKTFAESHDGRRQGWGVTMERLDAYVKESQTQSRKRLRDG